MQNTSIFIKNGTQNLENLQLFCTFANETPQQGKNTAQEKRAKKHNIEVNFLTFKHKLIWKTFYGTKTILKNN